jgi:hypothetical protein
MRMMNDLYVHRLALITRMVSQMRSDAERAEIARLWAVKLEQGARGLPQSERHRYRPGVESITLPVGKGLELTRV